MVNKKQNPRQTAVKILTDILDKRKSLKNVLTDRILSEFAQNDRGLLIETVYGVLRNLYYINWLLEEFYKNKAGLPSHTINNLRCSIYQLVFMGTASYAVTNEAVNTEKSLNGKPAVVNAILRNFLRKYGSNGLSKLLQEKTPDSLSILYSHPDWLIKKWAERFSKDELIALLKANNEKPPFCIAVKPEEREKVADYFRSKGFKTSFTKHAASGLIIEGQGYEIRQALKEAPFFWVVQDEASQLVCFLLEPSEGETVLDACASPGGKTLLTGALMKKGKIIAVERNRKRYQTLLKNIERNRKFLQNVVFELVEKDIFQFETDCQFDKILLDAPCSSLGVVRRNPDVRYRVTEAEIERLSKVQEAMLERVSKFLKPNGIIVYSVCSTETEEGERVIDKFLQKHPEFCSIKILRPFPHLDNMDGFFMAKLKRREV
ncbi:16S rRNA (cytosine(967)-C(5))-methyltransferase RsmB [Thermodesulfovibrio hydrogeniphilus]